MATDELRWTLAPAELGNVQSMHIAGPFLTRRGDYNDAQLWRSKAPAHGCRDALCSLAFTDERNAHIRGYQLWIDTAAITHHPITMFVQGIDAENEDDLPLSEQ